MVTRQIVIDSQLVSYLDSGGAKPVVIWLHGWGDQASTFLPLINNLSAFRHIAVNLPGFGGSLPPQSAWGVSEYAVHVAALLDKLQLGAVHACIGHSNGGAIAIKLLSSEPHRARKLVLMASSGVRKGGRRTARNKSLAIIAKLGRYASKPLGKRVQQKLRGRLYAAAGSDLLLLPEMQATFQKVVAEDITEAAQAIMQPTLLLWGDADQATPLMHAKIFETYIPNATLQIVAGAGHFVHVDAEAVVLSAIKEFLNEKTV